MLLTHAHVSQGQLLAVSPYESHLDERLFGQCAFEYNPQRGDLAAISGVAGIGGVAGFAFGGGRYRCTSFLMLYFPLYTTRQGFVVIIVDTWTRGTNLGNSKVQ